MTRLALALLSLLLFAATPPVSSQQPGSNEHQEAGAKQPEANQTVEQQRTPESRPTVDDALVDAVRGVREQIHIETQQHHADKEDWNSPSMIVSIGLLIVGLFYTGFAAKQWLAIAKQAGISERTLWLDQRPWVVATGEGRLGLPDGKIPNAQLLPVYVDLKNTGKTPALHVTIFITHDLTDWSDRKLPTSEVSKDDPIMIGTIGPTVRYCLAAYIGPIGDVTGDEIAAGAYRLTVRGCVEYREHADDRPVHTTRFCLLWMPPSIFSAKPYFVLTGPYNDCT